MSKMILNVIHRPEMTPEYSATVTGQGKEEGSMEKVLEKESLDIFKTQQRLAHENGLKCTIQMTYASLFNEEAVAIAKEDHEKYGDEIGLALYGFQCEAFKNKYKTKDFCIWMFSLEDKKAIVHDIFEKFFECFGFYPTSTSAYFMDADLINYVKEAYPQVVCAVATCWEEGPKAYHTCNNSWYTLFDGGPWAPWIPSKQNSHAPAANKEEDSGIVAIPHLSRDLLACYDGNGSNFGTHPQNVLRGMIYDTKTWEFPYFYNLVDQYRALEKYNDGYAYNMMYVGPGWMNKMGRWEQPYELLYKSYSEGCKYYGDLKKQGKLVDMTMSEFASFYREKKEVTKGNYNVPECALWRDILYGSDKQLFWYCDPYMRACFNMDQGGALVDLRPYAAKLEWPVGIGTKHVQDASYPFLIQEKYRAGYFTHYAGAGTVRSAKFSCEGEEVDLCLCPTHARFSEEKIDGKKTRILTLNPVDIEFAKTTVTVQTRIILEEGSSNIKFERNILKSTNPEAKVYVDEYITACYGTTEYPEDMMGIRLSVNNENESKEIVYEYHNRDEHLQNASVVKAVIPAIETGVSMTQSGGAEGYIEEGYAFSPMFKLGFKKQIVEGEVFATWLNLQKAN
ncbi:MAG: hypothetical protein K6F37_06380 [Lachnospiraceae bacterium]|nr:hypothetical protein [Lachnospiraceae bacterium]